MKEMETIEMTTLDSEASNLDEDSVRIDLGHRWVANDGDKLKDGDGNYEIISKKQS